MQTLTIRNKFEGFESKLEPFERDSKHSNANCNHPKGFQSIWTQTQTKGIQRIRTQFQTIWKGFEAFESKFKLIKRNSKHSKANSNHSKEIGRIWMQILTFQKGIRIQIWTIQKGFKRLHAIQIRTIWKGFETFECKF